MLIIGVIVDMQGRYKYCKIFILHVMTNQAIYCSLLSTTNMMGGGTAGGEVDKQKSGIE